MSPVPPAGRWLWDNSSQAGHVCSNSKEDKGFSPVLIFNIAHTKPISCWITGNKSPEINHSKDIPSSHSALFLDITICCTIHWAALCTGLLFQPCLITRFPGSWRQEEFLYVVELISSQYVDPGWSSTHDTSVMFTGKKPLQHLQWWQNCLSIPHLRFDTCVAPPLV